MEDLKPVYKAVNEEIGNETGLSFEEKWVKKYPLAAKSWMDNCTNLFTFFEYEDKVREIIYTTNPIEGMHRQIRKIIKPSEASS
ncbi:MAG: family transposase [Sphingobacterium sp.]|jgi:transposase-like protein|nr:family transposase [Sphingobacterium sp.]